MVVLAVICVGSVSASDYDNLTSDSQDMLASTDSIDVSQETGEDDVLEASDDEVLSDYNYDYYGGKNYYYDDSISGTILNSASGSAVDGSSLSIGQTVHLSLGNEQVNHDFGPDSKAYLRVDGDTNSANWEYIGTYQQLYTTGVDYTLKTGGSHYYQLLMNTFNNLENGAYTRFARGVYLENVVGPNIPSYSSDYSLSTDKSTVNLDEEFTITFKGNNGAFWGGAVRFYVNGKEIGTKSPELFSDSVSITTKGTPVGTLSITAYFTGAGAYEEGWVKPVNVTVVGSGEDTPSKTVLKLYIDSNKELVYGEAGTAYKLYNTLEDENGNCVYTYLAHSSDGSVSEKITIYTNGATIGQISAGAEPTFTSGVDYGFDNYGIWVVNASYAGNNNGLTSADSNDVVIIYWDKTTTTHSLSSSSVDKGNAIIITPKVVANSIDEETEDGKVSIYVDNKLISTIDAGKSYSLDTSGLTVGSHNIYCVYNGYSDNYNGTSYEILKTSQSGQSSFTVKSVEMDTKTTIEVGPKEVGVGDNVTITPTVTVEGKDLGVGDGKVAIYIDGVKKGETDPGVGFDYTADATGTFNVKAEYLGKDNYQKSNSSEDSFKVNKLNAELSVKPNNTDVQLGDSITLPSTLTPSDATGTISYTSDDGQTGTGSSFDYKPTSEGTHTITVFYEGDSKYNNITQKIIVNVFKSSSSIDVDELITKVYGQGFVVPTQTVNSTGNVVVRLVNNNGGAEVSGVTSQGNDVNIPVLDVGEYDLYVSTNTDSNHKSETAHATIIIIPQNSTLTVDPSSGNWGDDVAVTVSLGEGSTGISSAKIYDSTGNTFIKDATLKDNSVIVSDLAAGNYMIKVNNTVDDNHKSVYANATVTINAVASDVEFSDIAFVYDSSNSTDVVLTGASDFDAVVDGQDAVIVKGNGKVTVSGLNVGTYDLTITTVGDENHTSVSKTHKVNVSPLKSSISSKDIEVTYDGKPISVEYASKDSISVSYTVYDEKNNVVDEGNVKANDAIDVVSLPVGKYNINLKTVVDGNHESVDETYSITVNYPTLDFTVNAKGSTYPDNATIEIKSDVDGEYLVKVNNKTYPVEVKDGVGSVVVDQLPADTYPVTVTSNVANYGKVTKNANLTIKPKSKDVITLVENYDVNKDYLNGTNYQVRVLLNGKSIGAGKVVTVKTNGVTYKCKTDKEGYARLTITLKPGKYTITAEYAGIMVSNKINVKKVLKVKNVSKKKAKKIKFQATLKYSNGKAIVGKKVTFKLKGKVYTAKTNKNGIATVTFKNLKVGKFNVKVQYCDEISKAKLTIKK